MKSLEEVFQAKPKAVQTYWPLWGPLLVLAVIGLLLDVTWRRLNVADWFRKGKPRLEHVPGSGVTLGAFRAIKSGRREVAKQTQTLRERVESAVSVAAPVAGASGSSLPEEPSVPIPQAAGAKDVKTPEGGYSNRLLGAKRRAAEQIKDQGKKE